MMAAVGALQRTADKQRQEIEGKAWELARRLGAFSASVLASELSISRPAARQIINGWQVAGMVSIVEPGNQRGRSRTWEVVSAHRVPLSRVGQIRQQAWNAMRRLKEFSRTDLVAHCDPDLKPEPREVADLLSSLLKAGYLLVTLKATATGREARYRLIRDSGPRVPEERRVAILFDANEGRITHVPGLELGDPS
jgi:hypothetical protein